jgi:protease I
MMRALGVLGVTALLAGTLGSAHAIAPLSVDSDPAPAVQMTPAHMDLISFLLQQAGDATLLRGYRVAILATDGVDGFDLDIPRNYLSERGASVQVIVARAPHVLKATGSGAVIAAKTTIAVLDPSGEERVSAFDCFVDQVRAADYDAIYLPGNRASTGALLSPRTLAFLQEAARAGKPIFATGNAPLVLLEAGLLDGRRATGDSATLLRLGTSPAIATDAPLVSAGTIHTSRDAFDMPALMDGLVSALLAKPADQR